MIESELLRGRRVSNHVTACIHATVTVERHPRLLLIGDAPDNLDGCVLGRGIVEPNLGDLVDSCPSGESSSHESVDDCGTEASLAGSRQPGENVREVDSRTAPSARRVQRRHVLVERTRVLTRRIFLRVRLRLVAEHVVDSSENSYDLLCVHEIVELLGAVDGALALAFDAVTHVTLVRASLLDELPQFLRGSVQQRVNLALQQWVVRIENDLDVAMSPIFVRLTAADDLLDPSGTRLNHHFSANAILVDAIVRKKLSHSGPPG